MTFSPPSICTTGPARPWRWRKYGQNPCSLAASASSNRSETPILDRALTTRATRRLGNAKQAGKAPCEHQVALDRDLAQHEQPSSAYVARHDAQELGRSNHDRQARLRRAVAAHAALAVDDSRLEA